jgi:uridylate kinase
MENTEAIVISLGGSIIVPDEIDTLFLKSFVEMVRGYVSKGYRFVIITGGGKVARKYQNAAKELVNPSTEDLDWIGIASLKLNAELTRVVFGDLAHHEVIPNLEEPFSSDRPVIIGSAFQPGRSTDWDAVIAAHTMGAKKVINLSNIDFAYDKDPHKYPDARKLEKVSWSEYRSFIPAEWTSGLSTPFDPIASERAESLGIEVAIMNGRNIENLKKYLNGQEFVGTVIK